MADIKSVNAPAINEAGVRRLYAVVRPTRLKSDSTLFDAGYEQAKADMHEALEREVILPDREPRSLMEQAQRNAAAGEAVKVPNPKGGWWW